MLAKLKQWGGWLVAGVLLLLSALTGFRLTKAKQREAQLEAEAKKLRQQVVEREVALRRAEAALQQAELDRAHQERLDAIKADVEAKRAALAADQQKLEDYTRDVVGHSSGPGEIKPL